MVAYSRLLTQEQYGHYQNFWVRMLLLLTIVTIGLPATLITWSPDVIKAYAARLRKNHYLLFGCWVLAGAIVFAVLERRAAVSVLVSCSLLLLYAIYTIQEALLFAAKKFMTVSVANVLFFIWFVLVHFWVVRTGFELNRLFLLVGAGVMLRSVIIGRELSRLWNSVRPAILSEETVLSIRSLWMHLGLYDLTIVVFRWVDKFMISVFLSAGISAIYFNGSQDIPFLPLLLGAVSSSVLVQLADRKEQAPLLAAGLLYRAGRLLSCIVLPLFFFLFFFARELFLVAFSEKYLPSVIIFQVSLLVLPLRSYNYTAILQHLRRGDIINKGAVGDLIIACALMYPLYLALGLPGVALSFIISTWLQVAYYLFHICRLTGVSLTALLPLGNWLLKLLLFGGPLFALHRLIRHHPEPLTVLISGAVLCAFLVLVSFIHEWRAQRPVA